MSPELPNDRAVDFCLPNVLIYFTFVVNRHILVSNFAYETMTLKVEKFHGSLEPKVVEI